MIQCPLFHNVVSKLTTALPKANEWQCCIVVKHTFGSYGSLFHIPIVWQMWKNYLHSKGIRGTCMLLGFFYYYYLLVVIYVLMPPEQTLLSVVCFQRFFFWEQQQPQRWVLGRWTGRGCQGRQDGGICKFELLWGHIFVRVPCDLLLPIVNVFLHLLATQIPSTPF